MANRHSHKKLRADIRSRMAATGESYQKARQRILSGGAMPARNGDVDLVATSYFGMPITLATIEALGRPVVMLVPGACPVHGGSERDMRREQHVEHARAARAGAWARAPWMFRPRGVQ
jgi:hypothetical protein